MRNDLIHWFVCFLTEVFILQRNWKDQFSLIISETLSDYKDIQNLSSNRNNNVFVNNNNLSSNRNNNNNV